MRYLLIDRIEEIVVGTKISAIKNVALSEDFFIDHFVGKPVMPGALLIECLAQAGTALLEVSSNFKNKALLAIIDQAKFRSIVQPGDQLLIEARIISSDNAAAKLEGKIFVKEKMVMNALITFSLKAAEEFYPAKTRHLMEAVYDSWLAGAKIIKPNTTEETDEE